jgi:methylthioribose-1-phosphate isomerase
LEPIHFQFWLNIIVFRFTVSFPVVNCFAFLVVTPVSSINPRIETGVGIKIEERSGDELRKFNGKQKLIMICSLTILGVYIAPPEATTWNPAFDVTPAEMITAILTDNGNVKPADVKTLFN